MKIKILRTLTALGMLITSFSISAMAFEGDMFTGGEGRKEAAIERMVDNLGLSKSQEEDIRKQREEQNERMGKLRYEIKDKVGELKEELNKQDTDRRKVNRLVDDIASLRGDMFRERVEGIMAMKDILTPEQYERLRAQTDMLKEKFRSKRGRDRF